MINLESLFKNIFEGNRISDDKLNKFAQIHLERLSANNEDGMFSGVLVGLTEAYEAYFGGISHELLHSGVQKSLTKATDTLIANFKATVSRHEGTIRGKYDVGSPVYLEFFPQGLTQFSTATKTNIEVIMDKFNATVAKYQADLGEDLVKQFTDFQKNYKATRKAQLGTFGHVSVTKVGTAESRTRLEMQLLASIHTIALAFPGNVPKCMSYFDQSVIRSSTDTNNDGYGTLTGKVSNQGQPLVNVEVEVLDSGTTLVHTDVAGQYRSRMVDIGLYRVRFSKAGYETLEKEIEIVDQGDTLLDVELVRQG
jgi:hypothetical protein